MKPSLQDCCQMTFPPTGFPTNWPGRKEVERSWIEHMMIESKLGLAMCEVVLLPTGSGTVPTAATHNVVQVCPTH